MSLILRENRFRMHIEPYSVVHHICVDTNKQMNRDTGIVGERLVDLFLP